MTTFATAMAPTPTPFDLFVFLRVCWYMVRISQIWESFERDEERGWKIAARWAGKP